MKEKISPERQVLLDQFVALLLKESSEGEELHLNFICTHNSRRSQLAEVLVFSISRQLGLKNIFSYSGGTEETSFNYRMVKALIDSRIPITKLTEEENPSYQIVIGKERKICFSKTYDDPFNPDKNFIAITVCSDAEQNCPLVKGAKTRFHLPYLDPKKYDDTDIEQEKYLDKVAEIRTELEYVLNKYKSLSHHG